MEKWIHFQQKNELTQSEFANIFLANMIFILIKKTKKQNRKSTIEIRTRLMLVIEMLGVQL